MGRYISDSVINRGISLGNPTAAGRLRTAYAAGAIDVRKVTLGQATRIDHLAFQYIGDPSYWWAIAVLSNIGWGLQLAVGTYLIIPTNLSQLKGIE